MSMEKLCETLLVKNASGRKYAFVAMKNDINMYNISHSNKKHFYVLIYFVKAARQIFNTIQLFLL